MSWVAPEEHGCLDLLPTQHQLMLSGNKNTSGSALLSVGSNPEIHGGEERVDHCDQVQYLKLEGDREQKEKNVV